MWPHWTRVKTLQMRSGCQGEFVPKPKSMMLLVFIFILYFFKCSLQCIIGIEVISEECRLRSPGVRCCRVENTLPWPHLIQDDPGGAQATSVTCGNDLHRDTRWSIQGIVFLRVATFAAQWMHSDILAVRVAERQVGPVSRHSHWV